MLPFPDSTSAYSHSYGLRPDKNLHKAVSQSLQYINDDFQDIVDIDRKGFFDEADHTILLQLICDKVKCPYTLRLIRNWLRVPIQINGKLHKGRKGVPQGSPVSPLLSNVLLDELDKELARSKLRSVRYADDFSIYTKSKAEVRQAGNSISPHTFAVNGYYLTFGDFMECNKILTQLLIVKSGKDPARSTVPWNPIFIRKVAG